MELNDKIGEKTIFWAIKKGQVWWKWVKKVLKTSDNKRNGENK